MKRVKIAKIGLALLALGTVLWWSLSSFEPSVDAERDFSGPAGETRPSGGEPASSAPILAQVPERTDSRFAQLASTWGERYPEGRAVESRIKQLGTDRYRRQWLIATGSERIPWVIWEDKIGRDEDGSLSYVGSVAHMGNVFLVEAPSSLVAPHELAAFAREHGLFEERRSQVADYVCFGFEDPELGKIERLIAAFRERFPDALAEFDTLSFPSATPSDWDASRMWGLDKIDARAAWEFETGDASNDVVIAVIDTGMDILHTDLASNLFVNSRENAINGSDDDGNGLIDDRNGWDFVDNDSDPQDDDGHGTHVAGIAGSAGNNGEGAVGVNWAVKLLPLRVGDAQGLRTSAINDALAYVTSLKRSGINIVVTNNSYGSGGSNTTTRNEIARHDGEGIVFVAAAGNDGSDLDASTDSQQYPAGYTLENIISVANSNQEDGLNPSSNFGAASVDISAPGSEIFSTSPDDSYRFLSGTSMASPLVAGAVGLLAQAEPALNAVELRSRILDTGDSAPEQAGQTTTERRLNLLAALRPDLSGHFIEVTNVRDALVLAEDVDTEVIFELEARPEASVTASIVFGNDTGVVEPLDSRTFRFRPESIGQARIRFGASLDGITRFVEKTVVVGAASPVQGGLAHHFAFDGSGNTVTDLAGSSNGSLVGATRRSTEYGSSLEFNDASENMAFNGQFSDQVTIAALVRSDQMSASPHPRIVNMPFYYLYFSSGEGALVPDGNRQTLKFYSNYTNFGVWNAPPSSVQDDQWYYVVGTYDSTNPLNTPSLYLNGEFLTPRMQQEPSGSMVKTGGQSFVGNNGEGTRAFNGVMADVRIYNRELGADEVSQLGASLLESRWEGVRIAGSKLIGRNEPTQFAIEDAGQPLGAVTPTWYLTGLAGALVQKGSGDSITLDLDDFGSYGLTVHLSDGVATRVLSKKVVVSDGIVAKGHYEGATSGGGVAWLEVDESRENGYLTIQDPASGFYRIREAVLIGGNGDFQTSEPLRGRIFGTVLTEFSGEVEGYDVSFSGELQTALDTSSAFEGTYRGGGVGQPGDSIQIKILNDGRSFLWREGPFADLAIAAVDLAGEIVSLSASGESIALSVDLATESITGQWGDQEIFLSLLGGEIDAQLLGGIVGGYVNGSGAGGLYSEFIDVGEEAEGILEEGRFASVEEGSAEASSFLMLAPSGRATPIGLSAEGLVDSLAEMIEAGIVPLDERALQGIRAQTPVPREGAALIGFAVEGSEPLEIVVRGLGPSFAESGAEDPAVTLYRIQEGGAMPLPSNDDWREGALFETDGQSAQGAFKGLVEGFEMLQLRALADHAKDAAQRVWLEPGRYLAVVKLSSGESGSVLIEAFRLF